MLHTMRRLYQFICPTSRRVQRWTTIPSWLTRTLEWVTCTACMYNIMLIITIWLPDINSFFMNLFITMSTSNCLCRNVHILVIDDYTLPYYVTPCFTFNYCMSNKSPLLYKCNEYVLMYMYAFTQISFQCFSVLLAMTVCLDPTMTNTSSSTTPSTHRLTAASLMLSKVSKSCLYTCTYLNVRTCR